MILASSQMRIHWDNRPISTREPIALSGDCLRKREQLRKKTGSASLCRSALQPGMSLKATGNIESPAGTSAGFTGGPLNAFCFVTRMLVVAGGKLHAAKPKPQAKRRGRHANRALNPWSIKTARRRQMPVWVTQASVSGKGPEIHHISNLIRIPLDNVSFTVSQNVYLF